MADRNVCAGLEIMPVNVVNPWAEMYDAQVRLQQRLNCMPTVFTDLRAIAHKCIYWAHCIHEETFELLEWFGPQDSYGASWRKEVQMETIDILHFVFNIGMEMGLTKDELVEMEAGYEYPRVYGPFNEWQIPVIEKSANELRKSLVDCIGAMPWKNWKMYPHEQFSNARQKWLLFYKKLLIDAIYLCSAVCLSKQEIVDFYFAKNRENHARQDRGYGVTE